MQRCIQLAKLGMGNVAPNPMVGAILVLNNTIISEGYHKQYGKEHAEVNCFNNVPQHLKHQISLCTLYVSLEPCAHYGKTPPCVNLILSYNIKKVIIGCTDTFNKVNGKGIEKLLAANVQVVVGVLENECKELNKRFFFFNKHKQPYIVLKWAQTSNKKIAFAQNEKQVIQNDRLLISNCFTNKIVHKWRSEECAILVGTNTANADNPTLNNRLWSGNNPIRLVIDKQLKISTKNNLFVGPQKTIVFNFLLHKQQDNLLYYKLNSNENFLQQLLNACYTLGIQSILVEGGATLLQSFIDNNLWNEARIITNKNLQVQQGLNAPSIQGNIIYKEFFFDDTIEYISNANER